MKQKYFTKKQLEILPDMGYYVENAGKYTNSNSVFICINNGMVKYYRTELVIPPSWETLNWNCGPTKKCVGNYTFYKTYEEFSKIYPQIPKSPNDYFSEENGKSRTVPEKSYKLPEGFSYGYYFVDMRDQPWGTFEIIYLSENKIYSSSRNLKTIGQMLWFLNAYKNKYHFSTYGDLVISKPEVLDMRTFKQKPKFDVG